MWEDLMSKHPRGCVALSGRSFVFRIRARTWCMWNGILVISAQYSRSFEQGIFSVPNVVVCTQIRYLSTFLWHRIVLLRSAYLSTYLHCSGRFWGWIHAFSHALDLPVIVHMNTLTAVLSNRLLYWNSLLLEMGWPRQFIYDLQVHQLILSDTCIIS